MNTREVRTRTLMMTINVGLVALGLAITVLVLRQVLVTEDAVVTDRSLRTQGQELARALLDAELVANHKPDAEDPVDWADLVLTDYFLTEVTSPNKSLLLLSEGEIVASVGQPVSGMSPNLDELVAAASDDGVVLRTGQLAGSSLRILTRTVESRPKLDGGVLVIALDTGVQQDAIDRAFLDAVLVGLGTLVLILPVAWWVAGRFVRPIELLAETAEDITVHELQQRLPAQGTAEVAHLIESFNAMVDRLEQAVQEQRRFLNDASHELRTPLTVMRGHLEVARQDPAGSQDAAGIALGEIDRMGRIVDDLLVLARANQVGFLHLGPVDTDDFIANMLARVSAMSDHRWVIDALPLGVLRADLQRLEQIMLNLCVNAARHTPSGGEIGLGAELESDRFRLWVRDTGEGIDEADHERIFERFRRGSTQRSPGGSAGLGLSIVRAIAEAHGGTVAVESTLGKGARFIVSIATDLEDAGSSDTLASPTKRTRAAEAEDPN